ncbi:MAG: hypothetical protein GX608_00455 [Lentisphaerae bacterium]|nr:hypothetical protein [Lentisphaerota bacterium]
MKSGLLKLKVRVSGLIFAAGCLAGLATAAGFFGAWWWRMDLLSHFRVQYAAALLAAAAAAAMLRRRAPSALFALLCAINAALVLPLYIGAGQPCVPEGLPGARARILMLNVHTSCRAHDRVLALVREENPDVVVLEEVNARWIAALSELAATHTNTVLCPAEDNFGLALYSRLPMRDGREIILGKAGVSSIEAEFELGGRPFRILATHTLPPVSRACAALRDQQLGEVAEYCRRVSAPMALVGDLNASPWSHGFRLLRDCSGLRDSMPGFGFQATWPAHNALFRIPLDHCLVSDSVRVLDRRIGRATGSDHLPVVIDIELAATARGSRQ